MGGKDLGVFFFKVNIENFGSIFLYKALLTLINENDKIMAKTWSILHSEWPQHNIFPPERLD